MNRIEELHRKQLFVIDSPSTDKEGDKSHAAKLATEITVDIAIVFAEWIQDNNISLFRKEKRVWVSPLFQNRSLTTEQLFSEFQKTI